MHTQVSCHDCRFSKFCLPGSLSPDEIDLLNQLVHHQHLFSHEQKLYRESHQFRALYTVRSGCVKTMTIDRAGTLRITGFYLPGDILGFESIYSGLYTETAQAIDTVSACEIHFNQLQTLASSTLNYQKQLYKLLSESIAKEKAFHDRHLPAEGKLSLFLINLSKKIQRNGSKGDFFKLPMTKQDIGNYLALKPETISRVLTKLCKQDVIDLDQRYIQIKSREDLTELAY